MADDAKHTVEELLAYLASEEAQGSATRGADVYVKAQCAKCHRFDSKGESFGPDLTAISSRFSRKELLESILFPSHVISSQYASKTIRTTDGRTITGLVVPGRGRRNGRDAAQRREGRRSPRARSKSTRPSKLSAMPAGLLDPLTQEEIADLMAYLQRAAKSPQSLSRRPGETGTK